MVGSNDKKFGLAATVCNKIPLRAPDHWSGFDNISVITDVSDILVHTRTSLLYNSSRSSRITCSCL